MIQRGQEPGLGLWTLPGGRLEVGERLTAACARECKEETGLDVAVGDLVEIVERIELDAEGAVKHHFVIHDYLVSPIGGVLTPESDAVAADWLTLEELSRRPHTHGLIKVVVKARRQKLERT